MWDIECADLDFSKNDRIGSAKTETFCVVLSGLCQWRPQVAETCQDTEV